MMPSKAVDLSNLATEIEKITNAYRGYVLEAVANSIDEAGDIYIAEAKKITEQTCRTGTGEYARSWTKKQMSKAKYVTYIGNSKLVKAHKGDAKPTIPLINILEYTKVPGKARPVIDKAVDSSKDQIVNLMINNIRKVG